MMGTVGGRDTMTIETTASGGDAADFDEFGSDSRRQTDTNMRARG